MARNGNETHETYAQWAERMAADVRDLERIAGADLERNAGALYATAAGRRTADPFDIPRDTTNEG